MAVAICRSRGCERRTLCLSWRPSHVLHEGLAFGLAHSRSSGCAHLQAHRFRMSTRSIAAPSPDSVQFILDIGNTSARCSTPAAEARTTPACAGRTNFNRPNAARAWNPSGSPIPGTGGLRHLPGRGALQPGPAGRTADRPPMGSYLPSAPNTFLARPPTAPTGLARIAFSSSPIMV